MSQRSVNVIGSNEVAVQVAPTANRTINLPDNSGTGVVQGQIVAAVAAGTQTANTGTIQFANSNNVSFGLSTGNTATMTASIPSGATATGNLGGVADSANTVSNGTLVFASSNGLTFGMSGSSQITASVSAAGGGVALADSAQTATSGTVAFANSNNVSFGMSGSSQMTASISQTLPSVKYFYNVTGNLAFNPGELISTQAALNTVAVWFPLLAGNRAIFPGNMTVSTMGLFFYNPGLSSGNSTTSGPSLSFSFSLGVYSIVASSQLSLINSVSTAITQASATGNWTYWEKYAYVRALTFQSSQWSTTPVFSYGGQYIIATMQSTAGQAGQWDFVAQINYADNPPTLFSGTMGASFSSCAPNPWNFAVSTNALPATVNPAATNATATSQNLCLGCAPWIFFNNLSASF